MTPGAFISGAVYIFFMFCFCSQDPEQALIDEIINEQREMDELEGFVSAGPDCTYANVQYIYCVCMAILYVCFPQASGGTDLHTPLSGRFVMDGKFYK